jgi:hypothetical protein
VLAQDKNHKQGENMKRHIGKVVFIAIIFGIYLLVQKISTNNEFESKSTELMKQQGLKILSALDQSPGCKGMYTLQSTSFKQDSFFSTTGKGRSFYIDNQNNILDVDWSAEIVNDGKMIFVKTSDTASLQAKLSTLLFTSCRAS